MKESTLVTQLKKALMTGLPGAVVFKHHDAITAGIPDLSVTWRGSTTWLEVKYNTTRIRPLQHNTLLRLERQGRAFYVIYRPARPAIMGPCVQLILPSEFGNFPKGYATLTAEQFNHAAIVITIRSLHLAASTGVDLPPILKTTDKDTTPDQGSGPGTPALPPFMSRPKDDDEYQEDNAPNFGDD
jgi:hypothetical protein